MIKDTGLDAELEKDNYTTGVASAIVQQWAPNAELTGRGPKGLNNE